jgi:hypothetical protein
VPDPQFTHTLVTTRLPVGWLSVAETHTLVRVDGPPRRFTEYNTEPPMMYQVPGGTVTPVMATGGGGGLPPPPPPPPPHPGPHVIKRFGSSGIGFVGLTSLPHASSANANRMRSGAARVESNRINLLS